MSKSATTLEQELEARIRRELPSLRGDQAHQLAGMVSRLIEHFHPERIYVFGSRARDDADEDSDVDLMVVVTDSDEPGYRRDQEAYRAIGLHAVPTDILVWTREEFDRPLANPATLPATIIREGKLLYAA